MAIVSAATAEEVVQALRPHEPDVVLAKPFQIEDILGLVERFVGLRQGGGAAAAERGPPQGTWTEVAAGVRTLEEPDGCLWVRMEPGVSHRPADAPRARGRGGGGGLRWRWRASGG